MAREPILAGLFESEVVTVEVDLPGDPLTELHPDEVVGMHRAREVRLLEYRAGRHCARLALARLGLPGAAVLRAADRSPVWPSGFVGSITHTRVGDTGWCAASVARATDVRALGIDGELDAPLETKLWRRVLTPREIAWLDAVPEAERGYLAKVAFSAKEATYKCQHPVTAQFLEFSDVEVALHPASHSFVAVLLRDAGELPRGHELRGRYTRNHGVIAAAVVLR